MPSQDCLNEVEDSLLALGRGPLSDQAKGWIGFYCSSGMPANWIAERLVRSLDLKKFVGKLRDLHPSLSGQQLFDLAQEYLNGAPEEDVIDNAASLARPAVGLKKK